MEEFLENLKNLEKAQNSFELLDKNKFFEMPKGMILSTVALIVEETARRTNERPEVLLKNLLKAMENVNKELGPWKGITNERN